MELMERGGVLCLLGSVGIPGRAFIWAGDLPVSLIMAGLLGDRQAMECGRGSGPLICSRGIEDWKGDGAVAHGRGPISSGLCGSHSWNG